MTILLSNDLIFVSTTKGNIMELTPIEKSRLQYMKLYEEQIIFKSNQNKSQTTFKKIMQWITN